MRETQALTNLRFKENEDDLRKIASLLRSGYSDPLFLGLLAKCIDPDESGLFGIKLVVKHSKSGTPKSKPNNEARDFIELHIDYLGQKTELVYAVVKERFGVGRTTSINLLNSAREIRKKSMKESDFELMRQVCIELRDGGDEEYQPL